MQSSKLKSPSCLSGEVSSEDMGTMRRTAQAGLGRGRGAQARQVQALRRVRSDWVRGSGAAARLQEFRPSAAPIAAPGSEARRRRLQSSLPTRARGHADTHSAGPGSQAPGSGREERPGLGGGAGGGGGGATGGGERAVGGRESCGGERRASRDE
ncbi:palmitoyltransferase ZDHHC21 isoform X3 [Macaca fascicularis]|uniref:palmitoyltransferase ZDHHC21 isoform X3 n=1 Tax=Macaca fascicularis TaxID=9541 RepID=UPI003D153F21